MKKRFLLDDDTNAFSGETFYRGYGNEVRVKINQAVVYLSTKTARKIAAALLQLADAAEKESKT